MILYGAKEALSLGAVERAQEFLDKYQDKETFLKDLFEENHLEDEYSKTRFKKIFEDFSNQEFFDLSPVRSPREEARLEIKSLYRKLAKSFHPDTDSDEKLKNEKNELMQKLTSAYESKNYYELLKLQVQNLGSEETSRETLGIYLKELNDQIETLKRQKKILIKSSPFASIYKKFYFSKSSIIEKRIREELQELQKMVWNEENYRDFFSENKRLRQYLKDKAQSRIIHLSEEEIMSILFND